MLGLQILLSLTAGNDFPGRHNRLRPLRMAFSPTYCQRTRKHHLFPWRRQAIEGQCGQTGGETERNDMGLWWECKQWHQHPVLKPFLAARWDLNNRAPPAPRRSAKTHTSTASWVASRKEVFGAGQANLTRAGQRRLLWAKAEMSVTDGIWIRLCFFC